MAEHTKLPWFCRMARNPAGTGREEDCLIYAKDDKGLVHIAETFQYQNTDQNERDGTSIVNAEFIVQACNTHAAREKLIKDLVTALEETVGHLHGRYTVKSLALLVQRLEAALEAAKKEMP